TACQSLGVGIDRDELDTSDSRLDHAIDGVAPATANAENDDASGAFQARVSVHCQHRAPGILWHRARVGSSATNLLRHYQYQTVAIHRAWPRARTPGQVPTLAIRHWWRTQIGRASCREKG